MLEVQSQISFDDDNELFRQDTDAESDGEEQQELDIDNLDDDDDGAQEDGEPVDLAPAEPPSSGGDVKSKEQQDKKELETATPKPLPKGKEVVLIVRPTKPPPEPIVAEKKKPLTLVELPVDVLKEIVKEVGLRHPLSAPPPRLRVRQLLFYLPPSLPLGGRSSFLVWRGRGGGILQLTIHVGESHERPHEPFAHVPLSTRPRHTTHLLPFRHRLARRSHSRRPHGRRCADLRTRDARGRGPPRK